GAYVEPGSGRDLALLRLETPLTLGPALRPLCLPYGEHRQPPGTRCWALLAPNGSSIPKELVSVEVTPSESCGTRGDTGNDGGVSLPPDTFCITIPEGTIACQPDGGSPMACEERGVWFLAGTASVGGCAQGGPPIFTAAPYYERWIAGITREAYFAETPPDPREEEAEEEPTVDPDIWGDPKPMEDPGVWGDPNSWRQVQIPEDPDIGEDPKPWEDP
ncbi:PRS53 protease, partial [Herpetotheres cachinnans]|nr:PRS53 protease [Herpetotheres cachinnans]